jgi:glutamyl-Q tRNA(Asp) synthetase
VPVYRFHRLLIAPDGRKLSKSEGSHAIRSLRAAGMMPADVWAMTGLSPAPATIASPTSSPP